MRQRLDIDSTRIESPRGWVERAACRGKNDLFVSPVVNRGRPRRDEVSADGRRRVAAVEAKIALLRSICEACPVLEPCRAWALSSPEPADGMFAGGLTHEERTHLRVA